MKYAHARSVFELGVVGMGRRSTRHRWPWETGGAMSPHRVQELEIVPDAIREFVDAHRFGSKKRVAVSR